MVQTQNVVESKILLNNGENSEYAITAYITQRMEQTDMLGYATSHGHITNGRVSKDNILVAKFTKGNTLSISYVTDEIDAQVAILNEVQIFVNDATEFVNKASVVVAEEDNNG